MILALLAACVPGDEAPADPDAPTAQGPQLAFDIDVLDFGDVRVGTASTLPVTLRNVGDAMLTIEAPRVENAEGPYAVGEPPTIYVLEDDAITLDVTFTATGRGSPSTRLLVASDDPDDPLAELILVARATAPVATLEPGSFDFGTIEEACVDTRAFTLRNDGDAPLVVTAIAMEGGQEAFTVDLDERVNGPLPWSIDPGSARGVWASFGPARDVAYAGSLVVTSDDPANPRAAAALDGAGWPNARVTDTFVTLGKPLDVVLAVGGADPDTLAASLAAAIPALTAPLEDANVSFEVGAIRADDGCLVNGLLVDGTMTDEEQSAALAALLDTTGAEHTLTLLERALAGAEPEACNEDLLRESAGLVLIGVSDAAAAAPHAHGVYSATFEAAKGDADDVAAWAVLPDGGACGDADSAWTEVTTATGGAYLSVCDDLETTLATIAAASIDRQDAFPLSAIPWPDTVVVSVDGDYTRAFSYDPEANEIVFDNGAEPAIGSAVRVFYDAIPVCDRDE